MTGPAPGNRPNNSDDDTSRGRPEAVVVSVDELAAQLESTDPPVLLDVRWTLNDPDGRRHFAAGHLPGAIYVDLEEELAAPASTADGRHPLPDPAVLQDAVRRWGIRDDSTVIAYDSNGNLAAARAWWLLRWGGVANVRLLDGALRAWTERGYQLETGPGRPNLVGDVVVEPGHAPVLSVEEAAELPGTGVLLDARAAERYSGEQEPVDPRAGHIPGAVSAPTAQNVAADGRFFSPSELVERFERLGVGSGTAVGVYCGSGITAAHQIAALAIAGVDAALYPGSWSQWSADLNRPVATGPDPRDARSASE